MTDADVIVLGAGMAGLVVARALARGGLSVTVLEARTRCGGRALTEGVPGWPRPIELGAEFVHGRPSALLELIAESGAQLAPADAPHLWKTERGFERLDSFWDEVSELFHAEAGSAVDRSAGEVIRRAPLAPRTAEMAALFVEGFHGGPVDEVSARSIARQLSPGEEPQHVLLEGYGHLVRFVEAEAHRHGATFHLGTPARSITWRPGEAVIHDETRSFRARAVVVALPVSQLIDPATGLRFEPEVTTARRGLDRLAMGAAFRAVVRLHEPIWDVDALGGEIFLHAPSLPIPTWWTRGPEMPQITAWCGGPRALRLLNEPLDVRSAVTRALSALLERPESVVARAVAGVHWHAFSRDPWARGAYPFLRVGGDLEGAFEPVANTVFFAGDFTDPGELGTVGAAVESASRCAAAVLATLRA